MAGSPPVDAKSLFVSASLFGFAQVFAFLSPVCQSAKAKRFTRHRARLVKGRKNARKFLFALLAILSPGLHFAPVFPSGSVNPFLIWEIDCSEIKGKSAFKEERDKDVMMLMY